VTERASPLITRRALIGAGAGAALGAWVPEVRARPRAGTPRDLEQVEHIVILMQENISFDHYFGTLAGVRGFSDPDAMFLPNGRSVFQQPDPAAAEGYLVPWHFDPTASNPCEVLVDNGWDARHAAVNGGAMDGFVTATSGTPNHFPMAYYTRADVPWHMALADGFTVCDAYFSSVLGATFPNRYMSMTGTIDPQGRNGGPAIDNTVRRFTWTTYPERLTKAGVTWRVYHEADDFDDNVLKYFAAYQDAKPGSPLYDNAMVNLPRDQFVKDVAADRLPQVSWIVTSERDSEHPGNSAPGLGADYCNMILRAFRDHPKVWARTALIFTYDEDGGYFDHVAPPLPPPGTPDEFVDGLPIGLGVRVPTVVCSPWTRGGFVCSQIYDHTSTIRFIERRFGVVEPQISAWRRRTCGDLWECFDFASPDYSFPALPGTAAGASTTADACAHRPPAAPPALNGRLPVQEPGTRPRRPCAPATRPIAVRLPLTPPGQRIAGATIAVTGRRTRKITRAELRNRKVILRGLPVGTTARVVITIHRHTAGGRRRTVVVRRTLRVSCP
jgi:phospholipase C